MAQDNEELLMFVEEANKVRDMVMSLGWEVIKRDIVRYQEEIGKRWAYLPDKSKELLESRIMFLACDKLIKMVEDYETNKKKAEEFLLKLANQETDIVADVDTE